MDFNSSNRMLCRACLSDKQHLLNSLLDNQNLMALYTSCTNLQVNKNDNLPDNLCSTCIKKCVSWNSFKEMCELNESLLLSELNYENTIKILTPSTNISYQNQQQPDDDDDNDLKIYFNNSTTEFIESKTMELKVEFEEVTIKNENFLSDEISFEQIPNNKQNQTHEEISSSDLCDLNQTETESIYLNDKETDNLECNEINDQAQKFLSLLNAQKRTMDCNECGEKFTNKQLLKIHMRKHKPPNQRWECLYCYRTYGQQSHLVQHNKRGTCQLKCYVCSEQFKSFKELLSHRTKHLEVRPHKCKICNRSFTKLFFLNEHMVIRHTEDGNIKPFKCEICDKTFLKIAYLKIHSKTHSKLHSNVESTNLCQICGKTYKNKSFLLRHMIAQHNEEKPYQCDICNTFYKLKTALTSHMYVHTGVKPFSCTLCNEKFRKKPSLQYHMLSHTGERPFKCTECEKCFKVKSKLKIHMRVHTDERPFTCKICYKSFYTSNTLKQHSFLHLDVKPFKCDFCDKSCFRKSNLDLHMKLHTGEKLFHCNKCEKSYTQKKTLTMHMEIHADEKSFVCEICNKSFGIKDNLISHTRTKHSAINCKICGEENKDLNEYNRHLRENHDQRTDHRAEYSKIWNKRKMECPICKKMILFGSKYTHMKSHSMEKPFKCELCDKEFHDKPKLTQHMQSHSDERPFKCNWCDKVFKRKSVLKIHEKLHTGDAPTCTLCNKSYTMKCDLEIHMRSHTGEKPYECKLCDAAFDSQAKLRKHKKRNHEITVG